MPSEPDSLIGTAALALQVSDLCFRWPSQSKETPNTLGPLGFELGQGQSLFLAGASGSGKSTLLSLLAGIHLPTHGRCLVLGQDLRQWSGGQRDRWRGQSLGIVFQQFNLLPYLSVWDNVLLPIQLHPSRMGADANPLNVQAQARELLVSLDLDQALWSRPSHQLSVGQQQRVAVARALIGRPQLVIADEPTSALDEARRESFMSVMLELVRSRGVALVMASHDQRLAEQFDQRIELPAPAAFGLQGGLT
ncbi:MAG: hypothetical protein RI968_222 [Pseudomonadota bacterium]|jgi:putative ABC transport system ATP-binding protein